LKELIDGNEVSNEKRKHRQKKEQMKNYIDVQKRRLDIGENNGWSRAKEVELSALARSKEVYIKQR
jgi:hypothetical protein